MSMRCPHHPGTPLRATRLEGGLIGEGCGDCGGVLVSLLHYRDWAERSPQALADAPTPPLEPVPDGRAALACPKCRRLMRKYRVAQQVDNTLDLCTSCDEAWLDAGEWALLRALQLGQQLPRIFTEPWQRRVRTEQMQAVRQERLQAQMRQQLGPEDAQRVQALRQWLRDHPQRACILGFLQQD